MALPIISADSHITEVTATYADHIDPKWRSRAPRLVETGEAVAFEIEGMGTLKIGPASAAGVPPALRGTSMKTLADLHRGGWDPKYRLEAQDKDGIAAEVLYPTVGMILCNHPDKDLQSACFQAYNPWLAEYCETSPERLLGVGQTAMRTPEEGLADLETIKRLGLRGIMLPGAPGVEDYDSFIYDDFWAAAAEAKLPVSFHILAAGGFNLDKIRGSKVNLVAGVVHAVQNVLGMLILAGVFERHPKLKVVCVEGDAGWVPHYAHRLDRSYMEHRHHLDQGEGRNLKQMPSAYFFENLYFTFQDDPTAWRFADAMNHRRLLWANDFPHSDATWPNSQAVLAEHTKMVTPEQRDAILCFNSAELYGVDVSGLNKLLAA